ncbi:MAG: hypothetical protein KDA37_03235 [Planctomycetales bacterium]|nr:hypothetical protein [Planctomycetales bacterium]
MTEGSRVSHAQIIGNAIIVTLLLTLLSLESRGSDIIGLGAELPVIEFDVPQTILCRDVTPMDFEPVHPGDRLLQVSLPVSVVVLKGEPSRVREVIFEIDGEQAGLRVHDFSPDTTLASDQVKEIEVKRTEQKQKGVDASLGGVLPMSGGAAHVTPSVTAGSSEQSTETVTQTRLPPKKAVLVSGAVNRRQGVYFKLRQSTQSTLEGEHLLTITFAAPADWSAGALQVECVARGEKKWLFVKQRKVWGISRTPVEVRVARHTVAKPVLTTDSADETVRQCAAAHEPAEGSENKSQ